MQVNEEDLSRLFGQGWAGLDAKPPEVDPAAAQADFEISQAIHKTFSTPTGRKTLEWLKSRTVDQPCFRPEAGLVGAFQGFTREGQNSIYREILRRMAKAEEGPPGTKRKK